MIDYKLLETFTLSSEHKKVIPFPLEWISHKKLQIVLKTRDLSLGISLFGSKMEYEMAENAGEVE